MHRNDRFCPALALFCVKAKIRVIAEYALRDINKPIGVSAYQLQDALPEQMKGSLPTIEELEAELDAVSVETESEA